MEVAVSSCEISSIVIRADRRLADIECADNFVVLDEDPGNSQVFVDLRIDSVGMFVICFTLLRWCSRTGSGIVPRERIG